MPVDKDDAGREGTVEIVVTPDLAADRYGNPGLMVLATPALVELCERAAVQALAGLLTTGERTVGTRIDVVHLAPTPIGETVRVVARIDAVVDNQIWFQVTAHDEHERICEGHHGRHVVDEARFLKRCKRKLVR